MRHAFLFLLCIVSATASAQRIDSADTALPRAAGRGTVLSTSRPEDMNGELLLLLRNGNVISADEQSIAWKEGQLQVRGTLRSLALPCADVRALSIVPSRAGFRNGLAGGMFLSSMPER